MMNEEEEEIFMRPIQKQEVVKLLEQYGLLEDKNLKPLEQLADTDVLNLDLTAFYWNLLVNKDTDVSAKESETTLNKMEDYDLDILEISDTLQKIQWSELMEPKNHDLFEEFENALMQLNDSLDAPSWEVTSLKIFKEYAKTVVHDMEIQEEELKDLNELKESGEDEEVETSGGLSFILQENQENKMKKVLDLDKRIKELMEELGDEQKEKKTGDRPSLKANSIWNDTLKEVEILMKFGERQNFVRSKSEDSIFERDNKVSAITPQAERRNQKQKSTPSTSSASSSKIFRNDSEFKIPTSRAPRRPIQSPIGSYLKNSPTTPLIKKVVSTPISGPVKLIDNYKKVLQETSNNTPTKLPTKTYKPAARTIYVEKENQKKIPKNIHKLYSTPVPQVIKHLGRVPSSDKIANSQKSDFENNADLTILQETKMSEDSLVYCNDETENEVSLYVCKEPLHSNTLQK